METKRHEGVLQTGEYSVEISRKPYQLSSREREEMEVLFDAVMKPLAFHAKPIFLERLFGTDVLIRVRTRSGELAAFSNAVERMVGGKAVVHIIALYVDPTHRGMGLMRKAVRRWFIAEVFRRPGLLVRPLVVTASTLNPLVVLAFTRYCEVWPDLLYGREAPSWARRIAEDSAARFYPVQTGVPFQVQITDEWAGYRDGVTHKTDHPDFDEKFFAYADPAQLKLLFFVVRIRLWDLLKSAGNRQRRVVRASQSTTR
jgi:GNAT superfamily N-acetyltransferase